MAPGRLHEVEIVAGGQDSHVTPAGRLSQRFLAAPGLDHDVLGYTRMQHFVPPNHLLAVLLNQRTNALIEVTLEVGISLHAVLRHVGTDARIRVPLLAVDLVAADVEVLVREERRHLSDKAVEELVNLLTRGIYGGVEDAPVTLDRVRTRAACQLGIPD